MNSRMTGSVLSACALGALSIAVACGGKTEAGELPREAGGASGKAGAAGSAGGFLLPASCGGQGKTFSCVPTTDQGCAGGSQCDYSAAVSPDFACRPEGPPGQPCDPAQNKNCEVGASCMGEDAVGGIHPAGGSGVYLLRCSKFCCADSDCASPDWCTSSAAGMNHFAFQGTNIGVCWHWGGYYDAGLSD